MGRNYFGDIDGRFWFAVQNSNAADRFGVTGVEPQELYYYFDKGNLDDVEEELKVIKKQLGSYRTKMKEFFKSNEYYSDEDLVKHLGIPEDKVKKLLKDYADYELGMKIRKSILENGQCEFTAEY
jgi:hypothetical protein